MTAADAGGAPAAAGGSSFTQKNPTQSAFTSGLAGAGVGLLVSSVQNSLQKHNKGALGVFTRTGGTIGLFAGVATVFTYVDQQVANVRGTDDALNGAAGGCAAGFLAGVQRGSLPAAFGGCAIFAALIGTYDAAGGTISGNNSQSLDTESRAELRKQFFKKRPLADQVLGDAAVEES